MLVGTTIFTGCGNAALLDKEQAEEADTLEIGMCFDSFVIERWQKDRDVFVATAQSLGANVNVQNANGNIDKQKEQIKYFIEKKVDCLVVIPIDSNALADDIAKAKDAGIAVVSYDRLMGEANADLYISFDNDAVGRMMADAIVKTGAQSVVMICGPLTDNNVPMIRDGFEAVMNANGIRVDDIYYADGWKAELGSTYIYDNMERVRSVDAVMCGNDDLATSVIRALAVGQLAGVKPVVGQDADLTACQHIVEGTQLMTVYKPVEKLAQEAAQLSVKLARGEDIEVQETINDGKYDIPFVAIEPIAVTIDNIDEVIIDGGFHTHEEVYLNSSTEDENDFEE